MTQNQQADKRKPGTPGRLSRWVQRRTNARTTTKIRRKGGRMMGMDVLILHTVGRRSGLRRESPVAWFADDADANADPPFLNVELFDSVPTWHYGPQC